MKRLKKTVGSLVMLVLLVTSMSLTAFAKDNSDIQAYAVISSCPVCMSRNISTSLVSRTYSYQGQTQYITDVMFDYCRDCGFRTSKER